jgi:hypothetical protein
MDSFLFVFSFGQSKGKADKFLCIINVLDVLRESPILVSALVQFMGSTAFPPPGLRWRPHHFHKGAADYDNSCLGVE